MIHQFIYRVRDPATGQYWNGEVPGEFSEKPNMLWYSRQSAIGSISEWLKYTTGRVKNTSPIHLEIIESEYVPHDNPPERIGPETLQIPFIVGTFLDMNRRSARKDMTPGVLREFARLLERCLKSNTEIMGLMELEWTLKGDIQKEFGDRIILGQWGAFAVKDFATAIEIRAAYRVKRVVDLQPLFEETERRYGFKWEWKNGAEVS